VKLIPEVYFGVHWVLNLNESHVKGNKHTPGDMSRRGDAMEEERIERSGLEVSDGDALVLRRLHGELLELQQAPGSPFPQALQTCPDSESFDRLFFPSRKRKGRGFDLGLMH